MQLLRQVASLEEKIDILNQRHFGRNTEKASEIDDLQISFDLDCLNALNEAEHILDSSTGENDEPDPAQPVCKRTKRKGKRGEGIRVADAPEKLLPNSILTPSLAAGIFNAKYLNAVPLTRLGEDFARIDMNISRQTLANWMINISDRYLGLIYRRMHQVLMDSKLIHCDETPFKLVTPDKKPNSKAYMWVYHTMEAYDSHPIFLYDYQGVRSSKIPREFLKGYKGILVTDGYQIYHKIANKRPDELKVAGCWAHCKRKFDDVLKALKVSHPKGAICAEAHKRIAAMYHVDNMYKDASPEERLDNRQKSVNL